jgi:hypothetical protein
MRIVRICGLGADGEISGSQLAGGDHMRNYVAIAHTMHILYLRESQHSLRGLVAG